MLYKTDTGIFKFNTQSPLTLGTIGKTANIIDYSKDLDSIRNKEIALLSRLLNIDEKNIIMINQVHADSIIIINSTFINDNRTFSDADGMITDMDKLCLVIRTADCVPVFAFDVNKKVLGAAHSGWKGCRLGISGNLIRKMKSDFNSKSSDIHVYILPSIGPESYTVNMDVASYFKGDIATQNDKIYLNLWKNIKTTLIEEGIPESNIHHSKTCTYLNNDEFYSYRHGDSGRNLNFGFMSNSDGLKIGSKFL